MSADYEVVWSGRGSLTGEAAQELYQMQQPGKRNLVTLGLMRLTESEEPERDASVAKERQLVPVWKKRRPLQRKTSAKLLKRAAAWAGRVNKMPPPRKPMFCDADIRAIRSAYARGEGGFKTLSLRFGCSYASISQIVHRDTYKDVK